MKLQLLQNKLPKLPKERKSPIYNINILGKIIISKLPKSYLSYLNRKNSFKVGLVSTGKNEVSTIMPINKGFGKIGKIFYIFLTLQILFSCQNSEDLESVQVQNVEKNNNSASRIRPTLSIDDGSTPIDFPLPLPPKKNFTYYIRYNTQDDLFSINGGQWFTNPYQYEDCDQQLICAIQRNNCQIEFHSGLYKMSNPIPLQVPTGINVYYYNLTAETIVFNNPGCTYFTGTDIVHFNVTFVPY